MVPIAVRVKPWDDWEHMVPEPIRKQFPDLIETLDFLVKRPDSREAALSLFWKIYGIPKGKLPPSQEILDKLDNLERKLNKELQTQDKEASKMFAYLHIAGSLVIALEQAETGWDDRFTETLEKIEERWNYGYDRKMWDVNEDDLSCRSLHALISIICIRLFKLKKDSPDKWNEALAELVSAIQASKISGFGFPAHDLNPQAPVNTFENLWNNQDRVESWKDLLGYCRALAWDEALLNAGVWEAMVNWKGEEQDSHTFWIYAEGLCKTRLTLNEYRDLSESDEKRASETRLRNYFFYDCWDSIPEPQQEELKAIDKLWFSREEIDLRGILDYLKVLTEQLVSRTMWDPFVEWITSAQEEAQVEELLRALLGYKYKSYKAQKYQPALVNFLDMLEQARFREFNGPELSLQDGTKFDLSEISRSLRELNDKRNALIHPKKLQHCQREDVARLLKWFFGVDCRGILPFLFKKLEETSSQPESKGEMNDTDR